MDLRHRRHAFADGADHPLDGAGAHVAPHNSCCLSTVSQMVRSLHTLNITLNNSFKFSYRIDIVQPIEMGTNFLIEAIRLI